MIIVRAKDSVTGVVYEITSDTHTLLKLCKTNKEIIHCAATMWCEYLWGTDNDFDSIEVVAR